MTAPENIRKLIEHFEQNREALRSGRYNEAQLRQEFLNPFFAALGWDMFNEQQFGEAYKEVIHETSVEVEGAAKAPDYAFRIGGVTKFFVEAKKPSVNIEHAIHPAYQVKRYAWSAKLPLAILSDFEEFAVYDCRSKPNPGDQAAAGRVMYLTYRDYIEKWDEIAAIFSKNAIQKGAFDQYAQGVKGKRGTKEVDDAFLEEMEGWRETLARNLAIRNPELENVRQLNYAVQMTIDRIVFLRICEDRGIEKEGQLKELTLEPGIYANLCELFRTADKRYNSGLFHFEKEKDQSSHPDDLTLTLKVDDKVLKEIICDLYYPSPYVFKLIPADILGQVYERFLGKVIRLTAGHQAKVEEKPEVRKAGGVYYTPTYIVDYIVKNTVGKLLEGKTPAEAESLKIVDPACGSGSFLLGAFQYLIDWHRIYYQEHDPEKWAKGSSPAVYCGQIGEWQLTTREKKRILLNNLHGVDIDPQAVEVTKLSLLLKVLEEESGQLSLGFERALPDLGRNIQCGNSLIGPDYYDDRQLSMDFMDEEERQRVNAFDWQTAFPQVFAKDGFDAVIGNPPYHSVKLMEQTTKKYFYMSYLVATKRFNLFSLFIERAIAILKINSFLGFILPSAFLANSQYKELRKSILDNFFIEQIVDFKGGVFVGASIETLILIMRKRNIDRNLLEQKIHLIYDIKNFSSKNFTESWISQQGYQNSNENVFYIENQSYGNSANTKMLGELVTIRNGINTGNIADKIITNQNINKYCKPLIDGKDVQRYEPVIWKGQYIIYDNRYVDSLREEFAKKGLSWTARIIKKENYFEEEKIIIQRIRNLNLEKRIVATYDNQKYYTSINISVITSNKDSPINLKYYLGILNSKYINNYFRRQFHSIQIKNQFLEKLPIPFINLSTPSDKIHHDIMVSLVERLLAIHKRTGDTPQEKESLQREIEATDKQIDRLVYQLYGLTEEDISIVEGGL